MIQMYTINYYYTIPINTCIIRISVVQCEAKALRDKDQKLAGRAQREGGEQEDKDVERVTRADQLLKTVKFQKKWRDD